MKAEKFVEKYSGSPYHIDELARVASSVDGEVGIRARALLQAMDDFYSVLEDVGYELG